MENKKNKKLLAQVNIFTILIFVSILVFSLVWNRYNTQDVYLASKEEMINKDLDHFCESIEKYPAVGWFIGYAEEHTDAIVEAAENEFEVFNYDDRFSDALIEFQTEFSDELLERYPQFVDYFAGHLLGNMTEELDFILDFYFYDDAYIINIKDEHESCVILHEGPMTTVDGSKTLLMPYEASKHSAVREILAGNKNQDTIYERYYDKESGKHYYIGYAPLIIEGEVVAYLCFKYDWSDFYNTLKKRLIISIIIFMAVLIFLDVLLMQFLYRNAIHPIESVKKSMLEYMENKDGAKVTEELSGLRVRNEVGVLSDRFVRLANEMDRYTEEIGKLSGEKERTKAELSLANNIQADMLPSIFPAFPNRSDFDLYASMEPAKEVGGDFYDYVLIDDDHLALVIADVSGKGVPAALFMMSSKILISERASMGGKPAEILEFVNSQICGNNKSFMFVTVWLGILELSTGKLTAANAGHEFPMICRNGRYELIKDKHGRAIGIKSNGVYENYEIMLNKGDKIFVYTDGLAEAQNREEELFGTDRILEVLNINPDASPQKVIENMISGVDGFVKGAEQFDDLTMLCVEYKK